MEYTTGWRRITPDMVGLVKRNAGRPIVLRGQSGMIALGDPSVGMADGRRDTVRIDFVSSPTELTAVEPECAAYLQRLFHDFDPCC